MRHGPQKGLTGSALASRVAQWGQRGVLNRIQAGTLTIAGNQSSGTATITAVDVSNTLLVPGGYSLNDAATTNDAVYVRLTLTNSTTLTATRGKAGGSGVATVPYTVLEFVPGALRSVQYGTVALGGSASATATITAVDTTNAAVIFLGQSSTNVSGVTGQGQGRVVLTNATTVTGTVDAAINATTLGFVVVEWY